jgi:hypothetical protein
LQLQLHDLKGHCESRRLMVVANSKMFAHFSGYLTAAYLIRDWTLCGTVWLSIEEIYGYNPLETEKLNETNEMFLLRGRILFESGNAKKAIKFLTKNTKYICDDFRRNELLCECYQSNN